MPPSTEPIVVIRANRHAFVGFDKHMGNNITSGGIGKKDDSETLKINK
jgi:hypothetical protein